MFTSSSTHRLQIILKIAVPAILVILLTTQALAASTCKKVKGKFTLQALTGPDCTSAIDFCATGSFSGDLNGTSV